MKFRAKCGSYTRDWSIQVRRWYGWKTLHKSFMEPAEAQRFVDRLANTDGKWETLYPSETKHSP